MRQTKIAIFASGSGSNCENIIRYFEKSENISIQVVVSNKADAYAVTRAKNHGIPCSIITRKQFEEDSELVMNTVKGCDFIILAGCLVRIPDYMIDAYPKRIINIHPALLPKYGGKGMYGHHVHEAVKAAGEKESGITIHYVNNELDAGEHIAQFRVTLSEEDTPDTIADKVHELEMEYFPKVIEECIKKG